jgi:23S rRNA (adenine2030-N6)-methyltransferase
MNYRHAFHAGGAADVLKHVVLARIIERLKRKPASFSIIDLHAGRGFYDLGRDPGGHPAEWEHGLGRLYRDGSCEPEPLPGAAEDLIEPWRKAVAAVNDGATLAHYPGSPEIARRLAREQDRLLFNELQAEEHAALAQRFRRERRATVTRMEAWAAAKAVLPPPERRGIVLADPPYEIADEGSRALAGLAEAHRRFPTGAFCLWYPVTRRAGATALLRRVAALRLPKTLQAEIAAPRAASDGPAGSGLILVNPPWPLESELALLLPALAERLLATGHRGSRTWRLEWLVGERADA